MRSKWSKDTDKTEDDDEVDLDEVDFDLAVKIFREIYRQRKGQDKQENDAYILQRLREAAPKLTAEQIIALSALVKYHIKHAEVIRIQ